MHSNLLIVGILTIGFTLASLFAYGMLRLRLPSILGYLLAGYLIGPYSPGFVADSQIAEQLAEIGVILMLFGVGLHFKIEDLVRVKNIAIPGAISQTLVATLCAMGLVHALGWSWDTGLIIGLSIGVASTVVLVRILTDNNILDTTKGHIAVGWLVVEDLFTVIILILLPTIAAFSTNGSLSLASISQDIFFIIVKCVVLALLMFTWGYKIVNYILTSIARLRIQELFTLTILALVFLVAAGSAIIFGSSIALGAFIAGMVIGKTSLKYQAATNALPLKDVFTVIFFLSVGMLFNPEVMVTHFTFFIGIMAVILIVKPLVAYFITLAMGYSLNVALTVAISLAQIGEFSFILAEEAMNLKLIPDEGFDVLVACALISISLNPLLFQMIGTLETLIEKLPFGLKNRIREKVREKQVPSKVIVVGFGPIGKEVARILEDLQINPIIIEQNIDIVSIMEKDQKILFGDAAEVNILKEAHLEEASHLLITIPDTKRAIKIIHAARHVNPHIQIMMRIQYIGEKELLDDLNVMYICTENEALKGFTSAVSLLFKRV